MKSPMLKRRLNPFLLATIILVLSILAALSVLWQGNLTQLQTEKSNLSASLNESQQRVSNLEAENNNLSERIGRLENDLQTYTEESELLRSRIDSLNSTIDSLENENRELQQENEELSGLNETLGTICGNGNNTIEAGGFYCEDYGHSYEGE